MPEIYLNPNVYNRITTIDNCGTLNISNSKGGGLTTKGLRSSFIVDVFQYKLYS